MLTTTRLTPAARCSGATAMSMMMVEQLGLAMMPPLPAVMPAAFTASALISGITSGTPSVIRNAELLSTTCRQRRSQKESYKPGLRITSSLAEPVVRIFYACEAWLCSSRVRTVPLTVAPASEASGPNFLLIEPPALKSAMCTPPKLRTCTNSWWYLRAC